MAIVTIDNIPVYDAIIDGEDCGMFRISLVEGPAVMSDFLAFAKEKKQLMYAIADEEKRRVLGVVMRADFPIYRRDNDRGEYYIMYKADTIRQMAEKYLLESRQNDVNLDHDDDKVVDGVQMVQYFIKDTAKGIVPEGFDEIADGSLFAEFHIVNDDVWSEIKAGTYKGFSLEGVFSLEPEEEVDEVQSIIDILKGKFSKIFSKQEDMNKINKFLNAFESALVKIKCGSTTTDKGVIYWESEEDLKEGDAVYVEDAEGNRSAAPDGAYITEDEKTITVTNGKVESIVDAKAEVAGGEVATDNGRLVWDSDEDLKAGDEVFVVDEEGNRVPAPDGDYKTEDGKTIKVVDGRVAEITDPEAEVAAEEEPVPAPEEPKDDLAARVEALEALVAKMAEWLGIVVIDEKGEEVYSKALNEQMSAIRKELDTIKKTPLAKSAHEEFKKSFEVAKTGVKELDRLAERLSRR